MSLASSVHSVFGVTARDEHAAEEAAQLLTQPDGGRDIERCVVGDGAVLRCGGGGRACDGVVGFAPDRIVALFRGDGRRDEAAANNSRADVDTLLMVLIVDAAMWMLIGAGAGASCILVVFLSSFAGAQRRRLVRLRRVMFCVPDLSYACPLLSLHLAHQTSRGQ